MSTSGARWLVMSITVVAVFVGHSSAAGQTSAARDSVPDPVSVLIRVPGKTVELLGLRRWTPAMIQDSMDVYSPGDSITSHACGAVLRYELKFAEAAAIGARVPGDSTEYIFVPFIEPQDSALVRHRRMPLDTANSRAPWKPLLEVYGKGYGEDLLTAAVEARLIARASGRAPAIPRGIRSASDSGAFRKVWDYLDAHARAQDAADARDILLTAPNLWDRSVAIAVLSSFAANDSTWWALAAALRQHEGSPRFSAGELLRTFARLQPRRVDWRPAAEDLHAILNGANFWTLHQLLETLTATGVDRSMAVPLLKNGGYAVLLYATAHHPRFQKPALDFLRAVSGEDYGTDVDRWRAWVSTL